MNIPLVDFGGILFFGVFFLVAALNIYGSIYNAFSHSGGNKKNLRLDWRQKRQKRSAQR